jgi:hypothetical protein
MVTMAQGMAPVMTALCPVSAMTVTALVMAMSFTVPAVAVAMCIRLPVVALLRARAIVSATLAAVSQYGGAAAQQDCTQRDDHDS